MWSFIILDAVIIFSGNCCGQNSASVMCLAIRNSKFLSCVFLKNHTTFLLSIISRSIFCSLAKKLDYNRMEFDVL